MPPKQICIRGLPPRCIRVFDLSPGLWSDKIHGTLRVVSLDTKEAYEALSYTWGASLEGKSIIVNRAHKLDITDNLFKALKRLRGHVAKRTLWIDTICIDQNSTSEKNHQVPLMGSIYMQAVTVLAWLGEYPNAKLSDSFRLRRPHWSITQRGQVLNSRGRSFALALDSALRDAEPRWPDRAWVVQEFVLAQEVMLCFGPVTIAYEPVHIIDLLMLVPQVLPHLRAFHEKTSDMKRIKLDMSEGKRSIAVVALYNSTATSGDPRDKVYSLLSLIDEREALLIEPDYDGDIAETYARATYASITTQQNFAILELISFVQISGYNLPSWVVDFTVEQLPSEGRIHQFIERNVNWTKERRSVDDTVTVHEPSRSLHATGVLLDHICTVLNIPATNSLQLGGELAALLTPLLQDLFQDIVSRNGMLARDHQPIPSISPSLLLIDEDIGNIGTALTTAFVLWNEFTRFSGNHQGNQAKPFWKCSQDEKFRRNGRVDVYASFFMQYADFAGKGCTVFATFEGFVGMAPASIAIDDCIVLLHGSKLPLILRAEGQEYKFRGFAFVHGIMDCELVDAWKDEDIQEQEFSIC